MIPKVWAVARAEYFIAATSKAFIVGVILMPVFMGGALVVQHLTRDQIDVSPRRVAIVDETGKLHDAIAERATHRNEVGIFTTDENGEKSQNQAAFLVENVDVDAEPDQRMDVALAERVKHGELFAFVIIQDGVFDASRDAVVRYHSQTPTYRTLPNWLERVINDEIKRQRSVALGLSEEVVTTLSKQTHVKMFGLVEREADGTINEARESDRLLTFAVPFGGLMLMFMMIMSVAPSMLNNVLEEKMQKISEFLVSSVTPMQLMLGKLVGAIGIGLTLSTIYLGAAYGMAVYFEVTDRIPLSLYAWFVFFLFVALVIFGSIFSAIGAACSEIRDAQSLMTPVMLLVIIPMMCMAPILDSPSSTFSRIASLIPPATPMIMFMRIAVPPGPELWEIVLAVILSAGFAVFCVWAAGKVFRIGILSQGQAPSFAKLAQWIVSS